jgi:hypothetical protein
MNVVMYRGGTERHLSPFERVNRVRPKSKITFGRWLVWLSRRSWCLISPATKSQTRMTEQSSPSGFVMESEGCSLQMPTSATRLLNQSPRLESSSSVVDDDGARQPRASLFEASQVVSGAPSVVPDEGDPCDRYFRLIRDESSGVLLMRGLQRGIWIQRPHKVQRRADAMGAPEISLGIPRLNGFSSADPQVLPRRLSPFNRAGKACPRWVRLTHENAVSMLGPLELTRSSKDPLPREARTP